MTLRPLRSGALPEDPPGVSVGLRAAQRRVPPFAVDLRGLRVVVGLRRGLGSWAVGALRGGRLQRPDAAAALPHPPAAQGPAAHEGLAFGAQRLRLGEGKKKQREKREEKRSFSSRTWKKRCEKMFRGGVRRSRSALRHDGGVVRWRGRLPQLRPRLSRDGPQVQSVLDPGQEGLMARKMEAHDTLDHVNSY